MGQVAVSYYWQNTPCVYHNIIRHTRHHKYLRLITNCDVKVHSKGNVVDSKSQPSSAGNAGEAGSCPCDRPASAGLPENHQRSRVLSKLHCTLQRHTDIFNNTQSQITKSKLRKRKEVFFPCYLLISAISQPHFLNKLAIDTLRTLPHVGCLGSHIEKSFL